MFETGVSYAVVASAIAAVSIYHITDKDSDVTAGRHPLVTIAQQAFSQQRPLVPKFLCTYDIRMDLSFITKLVEKKTLSLK